MNNKKLFVAFIGALAVTATVCARPAPGHGNGHDRGRTPAPTHHAAKPAGNHHGGYHRPPPPPPPRKHHKQHHSTCGVNLAAGIVQTIANIFAPPPPQQVIVAQPTVVTTPTVTIPASTHL